MLAKIIACPAVKCSQLYSFGPSFIFFYFMFVRRYASERAVRTRRSVCAFLLFIKYGGLFVPFRYFVFSRGVFSLFRLFAWRFFVISSFRVASFRYFVFSRGFLSSFRLAFWRGEKTK